MVLRYVMFIPARTLGYYGAVIVVVLMVPGVIGVCVVMVFVCVCMYVKSPRGI